MKLSRAALLSLLLVSLLVVLVTSAAAQSPTTRNGVGGVAVPDQTLPPAGPQPRGSINFDDVAAPCLFIDILPLRDHYAAQGVWFRGLGGNAGGGILNECGGFDVTGHSSPNFLAFSHDATFEDGSTPAGPELVLFWPPASYVGVVGGAGRDATGYIWMLALNTQLQTVGFDYAPVQSQVQPLSLSANNILLVLLGSNSSSGAYIFDNLNWREMPRGEVKGDLDIDALDSVLETLPVNSMVDSLLPD